MLSMSQPDIGIRIGIAIAIEVAFAIAAFTLDRRLRHAHANSSPAPARNRYRYRGRRPLLLRGRRPRLFAYAAMRKAMPFAFSFLRKSLRSCEGREAPAAQDFCGFAQKQCLESLTFRSHEKAYYPEQGREAPAAQDFCGFAQKQCLSLFRSYEKVRTILSKGAKRPPRRIFAALRKSNAFRFFVLTKKRTILSKGAKRPPRRIFAALRKSNAFRFFVLTKKRTILSKGAKRPPRRIFAALRKSNAFRFFVLTKKRTILSKGAKRPPRRIFAALRKSNAFRFFVLTKKRTILSKGAKRPLRRIRAGYAQDYLIGTTLLRSRRIRSWSQELMSPLLEDRRAQARSSRNRAASGSRVICNRTFRAKVVVLDRVVDSVVDCRKISRRIAVPAARSRCGAPASFPLYRTRRSTRFTLDARSDPDGVTPAPR